MSVVYVYLSTWKMYLLGDYCFKTISAVKQQIDAILSMYENDNLITNAEHYRFLNDLLHCHPNVHEKFRNSIENKYRKVNNIALNLIRDDGSETDISYMKCLRKTLLQKQQLSTDEKLRLFYRDCTSAFREAIAYQIKDFRTQFWKNKRQSKCPITGITTTPSSSHIDHELPFQNIMHAFLRNHVLPVDLLQSKDNQEGKMMKEGKYKKEWQSFHKTHAKLRMVHKTANLSVLQIGRKKSPIRELRELMITA